MWDQGDSSLGLQPDSGFVRSARFADIAALAQRAVVERIGNNWLFLHEGFILYQPEQRYPSARSPVAADNLVATSQPLATEAGVQALRQGGNAVDAALQRRFRLKNSCDPARKVLYWILTVNQSKKRAGSQVQNLYTYTKCSSTTYTTPVFRFFLAAILVIDWVFVWIIVLARKVLPFSLSSRIINIFDLPRTDIRKRHGSVCS